MPSKLAWGHQICANFVSRILFEPPHDKTNKMTVRPAKTQISLGICPVWSESSLCTQWVVKDPSFLHADGEDSDQTGQVPRLIRVFAGRTCHFVGFVMRRLIFRIREMQRSKHSYEEKYGIVQYLRQRYNWLITVVICRWDVNKHEGLGIPSDWVLHQHCQFVVSVWYKLLLAAQCRDYITKSWEGLVDRHGFLQKQYFIFIEQNRTE